MTREDIAYERRVEEERLILDATELVHRLMEHRGLSRSDLARQLGRTRGFISQILDGRRNMTLRTLASLAHALDHRVVVDAKPLAWWAQARTRTQFLSLEELVSSVGSCRYEKTKIWSGVTDSSHPTNTSEVPELVHAA